MGIAVIEAYMVVIERTSDSLLIDVSNKVRTIDSPVAIAVEKGAFKSRLNQVTLKLIGQLRQLCHQMIMADRLAGSFPDMLLRVQLGSGYRKIDHLDPRMGFQELAHHRAFVPAGAIPKEHDRLGGIGRQDLLQMLHR
jgi:hypothetical protein